MTEPAIIETMETRGRRAKLIPLIFPEHFEGEKGSLSTSFGFFVKGEDSGHHQPSW